MSTQKIDRSDILAVLAIIVSFISLGLGIYEAQIMKQETEIMLAQQKTSVWPYISKSTSIAYLEQIGVSYSITNKGVGPALIKKILIEKDGQAISTKYSSILALFKPIATQVDAQNDDSALNISTRFKDNMVLSPGETWELIKIEGDRFPGDNDILSSLVRSLNIKICYSSIYGDTWLLANESLGPQPTESCDTKE